MLPKHHPHWQNHVCFAGRHIRPVYQPRRGGGAHLVGTAEAQSQLSQDLQHAWAAVALDRVEGPDSRQALEKAEVLPHHGTQVSYREGSHLTLQDKRGTGVRPLPAASPCMPSTTFQLPALSITPAQSHHHAQNCSGLPTNLQRTSSPA